MKLEHNRKNNKFKSRKKAIDSTKVETSEIIRSNVDPDLLMIRVLLALPMNRRTNFLRVRTPDGKGSHL